MGIMPTHTCTPYYSGCVPACRQHVAWAESSSLIFANSVIGAWTNRESNPTAISSALTGKTPLYGFHLKENRAGTVLVDVSCEVTESSHYSAVGFCVGSQVGSGVPVFVFTRGNPTTDHLKSLGAGLATSGNVGLFHVVGVTPEAPDLETAFQGRTPPMTLHVDRSDLDRVFAQFSKRGDRTIDHVMIGCPHASLSELAEIADMLDGKKVHVNLNCWICTSFAVRCVAQRMGVIERIERSGAHVMADTCTVAAPSHLMGCSKMATNSIKAAKYGSEKNDLDVVAGSLAQVVQAAIDGYWSERS
jgi:predicted aconitase